MNPADDRRRARATLVALLTAAAGVVAHLVAPDSRALTWVLLGGAVAVGELVELRPPRRAAIPLGFAVLLVVARALPVEQGVAVFAAGELAGVGLRLSPRGALDRLSLVAARTLVGLVTLATFHYVVDGWGNRSRWVVLVALGAGSVAGLLVHEVLLFLDTRRRPAPLIERSAELALVTSAMLMAIGYGGVGGDGAMGLGGAAMFSMPLLAAWYSFERLHSTRLTYDQTIRALSSVPELGGLVREGHAARVAELAVAVGRELHLDRAELEHLETAALLHHIGHVCLDDPEVLGRPVEMAEVAATGAEMLGRSDHLRPMSEIVATSAVGPGTAPHDVSPERALAGQVLRVVSAYDELADGSARGRIGARETLFSGPAYSYDVRVLAALDRVLGRREAPRRAEWGIAGRSERESEREVDGRAAR